MHRAVRTSKCNVSNRMAVPLARNPIARCVTVIPCTRRPKVHKTGPQGTARAAAWGHPSPPPAAPRMGPTRAPGGQS
jgi:hypothetical protein